MNISFTKCAFNIRTNSDSSRDEADVIISECMGAASAKSMIEISGKYQLTIAVYWEKSTYSNDVSVYFAEPQGVLFIGVGRVSAVVNIATKQILQINYPDLFWSWDCIGDFVLELGELECRLYTKHGKTIGSAPVDPPYDYQLSESSIEFSSIVMGKTRIALGET